MSDLGILSTSHYKQLKQGTESSARVLKAAATASAAPHAPCARGVSG